MQLITYYLEQNTPDALIPARRTWQDSNMQLQEVVHPQAAFNRFLYQLVGAGYQWVDRLVWSEEEWQALVSDPNLRTWVAYFGGAIAGYFELRREHNSIEILYFGLSPEFIGQGLGGVLLQKAIECAWGWAGAERVWLHTCSKDHPRALSNYQARGFSLYATEKADTHKRSLV